MTALRGSLLPALILALLWASAGRSAAPSQDVDELARMTALERAEADTSADASVRRHEYVLLVRTSDEAPDAIGRAEIAAMRAGGAVLATMRSDYSAVHADYRLLVRTRDEETFNQVLRAVRVSRGVLGATGVPLPETPTWAGGPGFMSSYTGADVGPGNAGRVVVRHDVPPIASKSELLEIADVVATPSTGPDGPGGFTLNVSEMFKRLKESAWRRREDRMRDAELPILPMPGESVPGTNPNP